MANPATPNMPGSLSLPPGLTLDFHSESAMRLDCAGGGRQASHVKLTGGAGVDGCLREGDCSESPAAAPPAVDIPRISLTGMRAQLQIQDWNRTSFQVRGSQVC